MQQIILVGITLEDFWAEMDRRYMSKIKPIKETDDELSAVQAREALSSAGKKPIDYKTFRKYISANGIQPVRKVGRVKFYKRSDLFKQQEFR